MIEGLGKPKHPNSLIIYLLLSDCFSRPNARYTKTGISIKQRFLIINLHRSRIHEAASIQ